MFEGSFFTKKQLEEMKEKSKKERMENAERINTAFQAMLVQVFSTAASVLLFIMMICSYLSSDPEIKKHTYMFSIFFWLIFLLSIYSGSVKRKNSINS